MITKRGFLLSSLAAPAIVRSASLMPLFVLPTLVLYADGVHDDTKALQAWIDEDRHVVWTDRREVGDLICGQRFLIGGGGVPLYIRGSARKTVDRCEFRTQAKDGWAVIYSADTAR